MLNVQTNVALSRRIRNITAYSLCSLRSCHPGHAGAGSLYRSAALPVRRAKLQLSRPMSHDQLTYSHSGQPAHAQQPRQQQQAAGSGDGPYTAKEKKLRSRHRRCCCCCCCEFFSKRYKGYFFLIL